MNPLYQMYHPQPMDPFAAFQQAMTNPAAFVMQKFPDIPQEIANDPAQILGYLQRTRGIPDQRIQQMRRQIMRESRGSFPDMTPVPEPEETTTED